MQFPPIPTDLINHLDKAFPEKCPDLKATDREVWSYVGTRQLVRILKAAHAEQQSQSNLLEDALRVSSQIP